jgi:hypothetical protein
MGDSLDCIDRNRPCLLPRLYKPTGNCDLWRYEETPARGWSLRGGYGATTLLATILHGLEAAIWAVAYCFIGARPDFRTAMFYSLGAITTYGHQNLYLEERWRLLGGIEALNGWLLFGLSTAFLFWLFQEVSPSDGSTR